MNTSALDNKNEASQQQLERLLFQSLILSNTDDETYSKYKDEEKNEADLTDDLSSSDAQLAVYLAASFFEYSDSLFASSSSWTELHDWLEPTLTWLRESDEDAAARIEDHPRALDALIEGLFALFSLPATSSTSARFAIGDHVLAVLKQDSEWHEAVVENIQEGTEDDKGVVYHVRFTEYGAPQTVSDEDISFDPGMVEELDFENACQICRRVVPLTFHHLIPRETHSHVLMKGGTSLIPIVEPLYANRCAKYKAKSRKDWLEVHGINICRKCHSQIHRVESNMSLARKFNTLESIMLHPQIIKWRAWASRQ